MGLFSSSKSQSSVKNYSTNVGFSDVSGPAIYGDGNVLTDQGAVESGERVAREGLRIVDNAIGDMRTYSEFALGRSLDFAGDTLAALLSGQLASLDFAGDLVERQGSDLVQFATQQNASADQRVEKMAGWALAAMVAVFALNAYRGRKTA